MLPLTTTRMVLRASNGSSLVIIVDSSKQQLRSTRIIRSHRTDPFTTNVVTGTRTISNRLYMHRRDSGWLLFGRQRNCNRTFPQQEPKRALPFPQQEPSVAFPATGTQTIIAFPPTPSRPIQQGCFLLSLLIAPQQTIPENSAVLRIPNQHFQFRTTPPDRTYAFSS